MKPGEAQKNENERGHDKDNASKRGEEKRKKKRSEMEKKKRKKRQDKHTEIFINITKEDLWALQRVLDQAEEKMVFNKECSRAVFEIGRWELIGLQKSLIFCPSYLQ